MIVADTDVLVDYLRGRGPSVSRVALELERGLATTAVTAFELWAGSLGSPRRERAVDTLLDALAIIPLGPDEARCAARIRCGLNTAGMTIGMADSLIAGICVHHRAILLTRNREHFARVPDLILFEKA